jgi:hypothetical protein
MCEEREACVKRLLSVSSAVLIVVLLHSTAVGVATINWSFLSETSIAIGETGAPLPGGDKATNGDGAVIQLLAWVGASPWGEAFPVLDPADPSNAEIDPNYVVIQQASVGDGLGPLPVPNADGRWSTSATFDPRSPAIEGAQVVMRFWNATSTWFNEVSQAAWVVPNDGLPAVSYDVAVGPTEDLATNLGRVGKAGNNFMTSIPEPTTALLLSFGLVALSRGARNRR